LPSVSGGTFRFVERIVRAMLMIDDDDAPEVTEEAFRKGHWRIAGKPVTAEEGKAAARKILASTTTTAVAWPHKCKGGIQYLVPGMVCGNCGWEYVPRST
jgi:hypothetical protein